MTVRKEEVTLKDSKAIEGNVIDIRRKRNVTSYPSTKASEKVNFAKLADNKWWIKASCLCIMFGYSSNSANTVLTDVPDSEKCKVHFPKGTIRYAGQTHLMLSEKGYIYLITKSKRLRRRPDIVREVHNHLCQKVFSRIGWKDAEKVSFDIPLPNLGTKVNSDKNTEKPDKVIPVNDEKIIEKADHNDFSFIEFSKDGIGTLRIVKENGSALFHVADVAKCLGYSNFEGILKYLRHTEIERSGDITFLNEAGVFHVINSRRNACQEDDDLRKKIEEFQDWVFSDILSVIHTPVEVEETGKAEDEDPMHRIAIGYVEALNFLRDNPDEVSKVIEVSTKDLNPVPVKDDAEYTKLQAKIAQLQIENDSLRRDADFGRALSSSKKSISVNEMSYLLNRNGYSTTRNDFFAYLRHNKYLCSTPNDRNFPMAKYLDTKNGLGYFTVAYTENSFGVNGGDDFCTTRVTYKGVRHFLQKLCGIGNYPDENIEKETGVFKSISAS